MFFLFIEALNYVKIIMNNKNKNVFLSQMIGYDILHFCNI